MVEAILEFFEKHIKGADTSSGFDRQEALRVATAALLLEMARMDEQVSAVERERVIRLVKTRFDLSDEQTADLLRLAERQAQEATDYFEFTSLINRHLTPEEKEQLIENLWQVAYVDGELHRYEEHLVHKIADLLYVPHAAFIAAKLRARSST